MIGKDVRAQLARQGIVTIADTVKYVHSKGQQTNAGTVQIALASNRNFESMQAWLEFNTRINSGIL